MITSVVDMELATRASFNPTRTAASKRFSRYKSEPKKATREADVKTDEISKLMVLFLSSKYPNNGTGELYKKALKLLGDVRCSAEEVRELSEKLEIFQYSDDFSLKAGIFLSVLINNGEDEDYVINTKNLKGHLDCLGYFNNKNITVDGDVGDSVGDFMINGSITVKGNAGDSVGFCMRGGNIIIQGNAGDKLGPCMKGGRITVKCNAGDLIGDMVKRGEIYLEGDYGSISGIVLRTDIGGLPEERGRKIYHKGKLIDSKPFA
jgi:hypothetical protein